MTVLTYRVGMEGGDINATFEFSADAEAFAKAKSRKAPEIRYVVLRGDEVVAGPYYDRVTAEAVRDYRNQVVPQFEQIGRDRFDRPIIVQTN